jgi:hypothetical protein
MSAYKDVGKRKIYQKEWARKNAIKKIDGSLIVKSTPESNFIIQFHKMRKLKEDNKLTAFANWTMNIKRTNEDFMSRYGKYMERDTEVKCVESVVELVKPSYIIPRLPIDYSKTLIYKIVCNDSSIKECYVGHTINFTRRKQAHKGHCNNEKGEYYNYKVYKTIRENGGWGNYSMIEIEKYPCKDINEACRKEREWFERLNSCLNTCYPNRSVQEYYKDHREEIATRRKQTFTCGCGGIITMHNKSRHLKTKFHLQYMERVMLATIPVVPPITDVQLVRGICYIPLEQFENIKQHKDINDDHFYFSNHYDYMHHQ